MIEYDESIWTLAEFLHHKGYGFNGTIKIVTEENDELIALDYHAYPYHMKHKKRGGGGIRKIKNRKRRRK